MESLVQESESVSKPLMALNLLKRGVNQKEVATQLGVSQATISNWYNQYLNFGLEAVIDEKKVGRKPKA